MVKLQWLQVNKFRSVKPGTRLTFNASHNVLLGQNGTGKTTLLNLIAAAIKSDFTDFKDEEFDLSYELASDKASASISVRNEKQPSPMLELEGMSALHSEVLASATGLRAPVFSYTASVSSKRADCNLKIEFDGKGGSIQRLDGSLPGLALELPSALVGIPFRLLMIFGLSALEHEKSISADVFANFLSLFVGGYSGRFDESLGYFNSLGERRFKVTRDSMGRTHSVDLVDPSAVMRDELAALAHENWGADRYVLTSHSIQFLGRTVQLLDFESAEAIVELQESTKSDEEGSVMRLGNLRFYFRRPSGTRISEKMLSYGQKRMLAIMHYLASAKYAVIADELVNGLHHQWIRACFELLGERQVFLTSQNPLLLDYLRFQSPEDVRSTFVLCRRDKGAEQMVWENMSQEAAEDFFDSYKVGFQQVGELLQTKGLW